jgi:hypothetical protein
MAFSPLKTDTVLIINPYGVLACAISVQAVKLVTGRHS